MTTHLFPDEQLAALEGTLARDRTDHLNACAACRDDIEALRSTLMAVQHVDVPEPSPLFWDHMSSRVHAAISSEPAPETTWARLWRPVATFGAVAVMAAIVVSLRTAPISTTDDLAVPAVDRAENAPAIDDHAWDAMEQMASALSADDVHLVVAAAPGYGPSVGELSARERGAFVRLLGTELSGELR